MRLKCRFWPLEQRDRAVFFGKHAEVSSHRKLRYSSDLLFSVPISLCRRFSIATTNLLNRSMFSISVSDVDSDYSLRLEDSEAEGENDEWSVVLQVGIL